MKYFLILGLLSSSCALIDAAREQENETDAGISCGEQGITNTDCASAETDAGISPHMQSGARLIRERKFGMSMQGLVRYNSTNFLTYADNVAYIVSLETNTDPIEAGGVVDIEGPVLDFAIDTVSGANPLDNVWWLKTDGSVHSTKDGQLLAPSNCRSGISIVGRSMEVLCGTVLEHRNLDVNTLPLSSADSLPEGGILLSYSDGRYFIVTDVQFNTEGTNFSQRVSVISASSLTIERQIELQHQATKIVGITAEAERFWVLTGGSGPEQDTLYEYQLY